MASIEKFKSYQIGNLFKHNNRYQGDGVKHENESIDDVRTIYNYHLKKGTPMDISKRLSELVRIKRKDGVVLCEVVVTAPKDLKPEDERAFFRAVYDFYCADFGEENVINAVVHKDEVTPHIHIDFVPVVKGNLEITPRIAKAVSEWREIYPDKELERLNASLLINIDYLKGMHPRLSEYVREAIGYEVGILNGATINGNKKVKELKIESLDRTIAEKKKMIALLEGDINAMFSVMHKYGIKEEDLSVFPLIEQIADLKIKLSVYNSVVSRNRYPFTKEELAMLREKKYLPATSQSFSVFTGSYVNTNIEEAATIVVEIKEEAKKDEKERESERRFERRSAFERRPSGNINSPQQKYIDRDGDLFRQIKLAAQTDVSVIKRESRINPKRNYIFIKTDGNAKTCMENLMRFEEILREIYYSGKARNEARLYMDSLDDDTYDLAQTILRKNKIPAYYFIRKEGMEEEKQQQEIKEKENADE